MRKYYAIQNIEIGSRLLCKRRSHLIDFDFLNVISPALASNYLEVILIVKRDQNRQQSG